MHRRGSWSTTEGSLVAHRRVDSSVVGAAPIMSVGYRRSFCHHQFSFEILGRSFEPLQCLVDGELLNFRPSFWIAKRLRNR